MYQMSAETSCRDVLHRHPIEMSYILQRSTALPRHLLLDIDKVVLGGLHGGILLCLMTQADSSDSSLWNTMTAGWKLILPVIQCAYKCTIYCIVPYRCTCAAQGCRLGVMLGGGGYLLGLMELCGHGAPNPSLQPGSLEALGSMALCGAFLVILRGCGNVSHEALLQAKSVTR